MIDEDISLFSGGFALLVRHIICNTKTHIVILRHVSKADVST